MVKGVPRSVVVVFTQSEVKDKLRGIWSSCLNSNSYWFLPLTNTRMAILSYTKGLL